MSTAIMVSWKCSACERGSTVWVAAFDFCIDTPCRHCGKISQIESVIKSKLTGGFDPDFDKIVFVKREYKSTKGKRIREERMRLKITMREMAEKMDISHVKMGRLERGEDLVNSEMWDAFCRALDELETPSF